MQYIMQHINENNFLGGMTKEYRYSHPAIIFNTFIPKTFYINEVDFKIDEN